MTTSVPPSAPERFKDADFASLPAEIREKFEKVRETRRGMYIWGPVGTGKTHAAYAIKKKAKDMGFTTRMLSAPEMFDLIRDDFDHKDSFNFERMLANRGIFIIDDLGKEKPSDWVAERLYMLINKRYEEVLPTIITSNLELAEISERFGDHISSRLFEMVDVIKLDGADRRLL